MRINWKKHILIFAVIFLLGALFIRPGGCGAGGEGTGRPADVRIVELKAPEMPGDASHQSAQSYTLLAEVADTVEKRKRGLSGRRGLEPGYAMLYVYDEPRKPAFTEADTGFPLSVAFVKADGTIVRIRKTEPKDPALFVPDEPVKFVLEVRSGWFEDRDIKVGDRLEMPAELAPPPSGHRADAEASEGSRESSEPAGVRADTPDG